MTESDFVFNIFYGLFCYCVVYPPVEFESLGLTTNRLFSSWLGQEDLQFVQYHMRRTTLNLAVHALLPVIYIILYLIYNMGSKPLSHFSYLVALLALPILVIFMGTVVRWIVNAWNEHPITLKLKRFSNNPSEWQPIAESINAEYRRHDKIISKTNTINKVIATENWLILTSMYDVYFAHQSDTTLVADKSEVHEIAPDSNDAVQYVQIQVNTMRTGVKPFKIRINTNDFKNLKDRLTTPIIILSHVRFQSSIIERFIEVFKQQINLNPRYETDEVNETCFGCMQQEPNLKLQKNCLDVNENGDVLPNSQRCGECFCRPMWCVSCMAQWFASRQNNVEREVWLQQKCTCPMCRATFCIHDVCYIVKTNN